MERWEQLSRVPAPALAPAFGPLTGMRVLMTGSMVAAPFAATLLAEYGAEVIHVERPDIGDTFRGQAPVVALNGGKFVVSDPSAPVDEKVSTGWMQEARNKLSMTLEINLKIPQVKEIFLSLVKNCDVWLENMVWVEKLGITDEMMLAVNPKLVIAHISGFGRPQFGGVPEDCDRPCYDPIAQFEGGYAYLNGFPEPMPPTFGASFINDYITGLFAAFGVVSAWHHAKETGVGQVIDIAQVECMSRCLNDTFMSYFTLGFVKERFGQKLPIFQPGNAFKTKDGYLNIGAVGPAVYAKSLKAMGIDIAKYPYEKAGGSREAVNSPLGQELDREIQTWMLNHTSEEALAIFIKAKAPAGIARTAAELANSAHYKSRGNWIQYTDQTLNAPVTAFGFTPKMSKTPPQAWRGAPSLGQDTEAILKAIAQYSDAEIAGMKGLGIIDPVPAK